MRAAFNRCDEEFDELAIAIADLERDPTGEHISKARQECADVMITMYRVIEKLGGSLRDEVDAKMDINRARKWNVGADGIGYHIKRFEIVEVGKENTERSWAPDALAEMIAGTSLPPSGTDANGTMVCDDPVAIVDNGAP